MDDHSSDDENSKETEDGQSVTTTNQQYANAQSSQLSQSQFGQQSHPHNEAFEEEEEKKSEISLNTDSCHTWSIADVSSSQLSVTRVAIRMMANNALNPSLVMGSDNRPQDTSSHQILDNSSQSNNARLQLNQEEEEKKHLIEHSSMTTGHSAEVKDDQVTPENQEEENKQNLGIQDAKKQVPLLNSFDHPHTPRLRFSMQKEIGGKERLRKNSAENLTFEQMTEQKFWQNLKHVKQLEIINLEFKDKNEMRMLNMQINSKWSNSFIVRLNYNDQDLLLNKDNFQAPANDGINQKHSVLIHSKIIRLFFNKFYLFLHQTLTSLIKVLAPNQIMIESEEDLTDQDNKLIIEKLLSISKSKKLDSLALCSKELTNQIFKNDEGDLKALDDFIFETQMIQIMESYSIRSAYLPSNKQIIKVQGNQISYFMTQYRYNELLILEKLQNKDINSGRTQYFYYYLLQILGILIDVETFKEDGSKKQVDFLIDNNDSLQIAKLSSSGDNSILKYLLNELYDEIHIEIDLNSENLREQLMSSYLKMLKNEEQFKNITQFFIYNQLYSSLTHFWTYYSFGKNTESFFNQLFNSSSSGQRQELALFINGQVQSMHFRNQQSWNIIDESGEEGQEPSYRFNLLTIQWQYDVRQNPWLVNGQALEGKPQWKDFTADINNILEMAFNERQEIAEFRLDEPYYVELSAFIQRFYQPEKRDEENEKLTVHRARQIRRQGLRFCLLQLQSLVGIYSKFQNQTKTVSNELSQLFLKSVQEIFPRCPIETIVGQLLSLDDQYDEMIFFKKLFVNLQLFFNAYFIVEEDFQGQLILDVFALYFHRYDIEGINDKRVVDKLFTFFNYYTEAQFLSQGVQHLRDKYNINDRINKKRKNI